MKPLRMIAGHSLLHRTIALARRATVGLADVQLLVATDDMRIVDHAAEVGVLTVMTDAGISSGSGRALAAIRHLTTSPDIIVNLQGDAPFQPAAALVAVIEALAKGNADVATPVVQLDWPALDALRAHKLIAPFSGTTCARTANGRALWFSKTIMPAIRDEDHRRTESLSPVWRHIGLYAYRLAALEAFEATPPTDLEQLEGLEQLRLLELGLTIDAVAVAPARFDISGIDTEVDVTRAELLIAMHGDPLDTP